MRALLEKVGLQHPFVMHPLIEYQVSEGGGDILIESSTGTCYSKGVNR